MGNSDTKKHLYNKENGLLTQSVDMPICSVLVRVRAYWSGQGTIWTIRTNTDANGYFHATLSWEVPQNIFIYAHPIVYIWGPTPSNCKILVSDPTPPFSIYRDPLDTTIWFLSRVQGGVDTIWTGTNTYDFGTMYIDSFVSGINPQPKSGAANIYEIYLHARTFMEPPPSWPLRILWEPIYAHGTAYRNDTIWVHGDTSDTDEWDDDVLLHEFGHYLMNNYAQLQPTVTDTHYWHKDYPNDTCLAYKEGWATFFSGRARVGSGTDSLYVDNSYIAGPVNLWRNIENPWLGNNFDTLQFQGGPWCEGAVAGALWDIYDSHDEVPYDSHPWPGFPDTSLADSLTMGFAPIWDVFDNYNPPGEPTNCWTIFHFRSGWNAFNYNHAYAVNEIFLHHRIRDSIPAKPIGLSAAQVGNAVRLYWRKNLEFDLQGYRIYRRSKKEFVIPPQPWGSWVFLADKGSPNDTTHLDQTVQSGWRYRYRVTAYDSLGNESEYSDSVEIFVQFGINPDDIEMFSFCVPPLIAMKGDLKICYSSVVNNQKVILKLYDICGRLVHKQDIVLKKGID
ncbi:MAG: fibronectin type III domain-containing protein, partial [candidate division WOR-3 bacterium]